MKEHDDDECFRAVPHEPMAMSSFVYFNLFLFRVDSIIEQTTPTTHRHFYYFVDETSLL